MLRKLLLTCSVVGFLAACKSDEETARERLTEAVELTRTASSVVDPSARFDQLSRAQEILDAIRKDYPGTAAALSIASGEVIGAVSLADFPAQLEEARVAAAVANCAEAPEASCLVLPLLLNDAARAGVSLAEARAKVPAEIRLFIDLIDHSGPPASEWTGQVRPANDEPLLYSLSQLLEAGREDVVRDWMAATTAAPGSQLTDFPAFLNLTAERGSGRNFSQNPALHEAIARLVESDREAALPLVLGKGGPDALRTLLADEKDGPAAVAQWTSEGLLYDGSDAMGIMAIALWERGDKEVAREIYASPPIRTHRALVGRISEFAPKDAALDLLLAALPHAEGYAATRVAMTLIGLGPDGAPQGLAALRDRPDLAASAKDYALETGSALAEQNLQPLFDELHNLLTEVASDAVGRLAAGWHMGRALAGDDASATAIIEATGESDGLFVLNRLFTELIRRGEPDRVRAIYDLLAIPALSPGDGRGYIVNLALLAGDFDQARSWLRQFRPNTVFNPEDALRLRLVHESGLSDETLFPLLATLDPHAMGGAAAAIARNEQRTGRGYPELAARYALSLTGPQQAEALGRLVNSWPGTRK